MIVPDDSIESKSVSDTRSKNSKKQKVTTPSSDKKKILGQKKHSESFLTNDGQEIVI